MRGGPDADVLKIILDHLAGDRIEVLQVTKLMTVFDTYDSEEAAIQSFSK